MEYERIEYHPHQEESEHLTPQEIERYVVPIEASLLRWGFDPSTLFEGVGEIQYEEVDGGIVVPRSEGEVNELSSNHCEKRLILLNGLLAFSIGEKSSRMTFDAMLPDYLKPGLSSDSYVNFFRTAVFHHIPNTIYKHNKHWNVTEPRYRAGTTISLHSNSKSKEYSLRIEAQNAAFIADFLNPKDEISMMDIKASAPFTPHDAYRMTLRYGDESGKSDQVVLELPHTRNKEQVWHTQTNAWLLSMTAGYAKGPNHEDIVQKMSEKIQTIMEKIV